MTIDHFPAKSDFVPTTIVQDIVNNVGGFGRWWSLIIDHKDGFVLNIVQLITKVF